MTVKMGRLLIVGASGHGRMVADCASALGRWTEIIFFGDRHPNIDHKFKWPVRGSIASIQEAAGTNDEVSVAIGNCATRGAMLTRLRGMNLKLATLIHPHASVSTDTKIEYGTIVVAGAVVISVRRLGLAASSTRVHLSITTVFSTAAFTFALAHDWRETFASVIEAGSASALSCGRVSESVQTLSSARARQL